VKLYILVRGKPNAKLPQATYCFQSYKEAASYALHLMTGVVKEESIIHEMDFDLNAGFQTVNVTQLNPDGSRQDEEYRRDQQRVADSERRFLERAELTDRGEY